MGGHQPHAELRIDGGRLIGRLHELARIGPITGPDGSAGSCRMALTDEDRDGRDLVVTWMRDLGMDVTVDGIGNVIGVRPGRRDGPPVMCGSHIDTVRTGGIYDGNLGVLAGLEVVETLETAGVVTDRPVAVGFFTDEEGSRFPPDMLGSLVYAGGLPLEAALAAVDSDGVSVGEELDRIGYRGTAPCPGPAPHAFVELHVEQGPVLEAEGVTIGAVTGVQGISWTAVEVAGQSNHAGTTPMAMRHDAGWVAAAITTFVRQMAWEMGGAQVATVGTIDLHPDLVNVVAARAHLTVDLRNTDEALLREAEARLAAELDRLAAAEGVEISTESMARFEPVVFDEGVIRRVEETASRLGHPVMRMPSGAGHDAQMLARVCPTGMIFVPSRAGISHNPAEHTDPEHLVAGADVLLQTMLGLATIEPRADDTAGDGGTT